MALLKIRAMFLLCLSFLVPCLPGNAASRPNILLILADDLGWSDLGCYGGEIHTPNLDSLARNGLRFTQFYNNARCCPSRAALLTGLHPHQAGVGLMDGDAGPDYPGYRGHLTDRCATIAELLQTAGYQTYMVGKWHLGRNPGPVQRGFGEFYGMLGGFNSCWNEHPYYTRLPEGRSLREYPESGFYSTDVFGDYALEFLDQASNAKERPWFLYLAFNAPHFPLHAPKGDIAKYETIYSAGWDQVRQNRFEKQQILGLVPPDSQLTPRSLIPTNAYNRQTGWAGKANPDWASLPAERRADLAHRMAVYAAMVDRLDQSVGRVLAWLREHRAMDNTLIFFLSDNGACAEWDPFGFDGSSGPKNILHTGDDLERVGGPGSYISYGSGWANACNSPWRLYKHYGHEGGIATPLIVHWPQGIPATGELRTQPGHVIDLLPTCLEAAGVTYPATFGNHQILPLEGKSLMPVFRGQPLVREPLAWEHEGNRAIRDGDWKLVSLRGQSWELYNMVNDRTELKDLAGQYPDRVRELAARWESWAQRTLALPRPADKRSAQDPAKMKAE